MRLHADRLHAVVIRLVDDRHDAEEATQEAFLRAWRSIGRFKGDSQFFTWLYRIGVNEAHRLTARRAGRGPASSLEEQVVPPADPRPGPAASVQHDDLREALESAIRALDHDYRAPLVLRDIEGLSTAEAAAIMDIGEAAFKSRLHRARLAVRDAVRDHLPAGRRPMMLAMLRHPLAFRRDHRFTMERASEFLDGELTPRDRARLEHHAHVCPMCSRFLASLRRTVSALSRLGQAPGPSGSVTGGVLDRLRAETGDGCDH